MNKDLEEETNYPFFSGVMPMSQFLLKTFYLFVALVQLVLDLLLLLSLSLQTALGLIQGFTEAAQRALGSL